MKMILGIVTFSIFLILIMPSLNLVYADEISEPSKKIWKTEVNKQILITADVTNNQDIKQSFVYIIQVLNDEGKVVVLNWISGTLESHQSMSPAQSWIPSKTGTYTAQIFVWPCLANCGAISEPLQMNIVVT